MGSYARAREEVLAGRADVCGSAVHATTREGVARELGPELVVLGVSDACTNDGIVAGPALEAAPREEIERAISGLHLRDPELVRELFEAERFEPAPPGTYREVYRLVFAAMPGHPRWGARSPGADGASGGA